MRLAYIWLYQSFYEGEYLPCTRPNFVLISTDFPLEMAQQATIFFLTKNPAVYHVSVYSNSPEFLLWEIPERIVRIRT